MAPEYVALYADVVFAWILGQVCLEGNSYLRLQGVFLHPQIVEDLHSTCNVLVD